MKDFFLEPECAIEMYRKGVPALKELYGADIPDVCISTPPVSYGHANTLGVELEFPEDGEVNHGKLCDSLEEAVEILKKPVDFTKQGMFPFYLNYKKELEKAFPGKEVNMWFAAEGPMTTAYTLRKDDLFFDPFDNPELFKEFMDLVTDSIIDYKKIFNRIHGKPEFSEEGFGLADDLAAMFSPEQWYEFVIPYIDKYFRGLTSGKRSAHIEDLRPDHIPLLEKLELVSFDPSVSPKINPFVISEKCRVPFAWRLCNFHYTSLTLQEVKDFVFKSAEDGASGVITYVADGMCNKESVDKVNAFKEAAVEVQKMLAEGATRTDIGKLISAAGRKKFWDNWPE